MNENQSRPLPKNSMKNPPPYPKMQFGILLTDCRPTYAALFPVESMAKDWLTSSSRKGTVVDFEAETKEVVKAEKPKPAKPRNSPYSRRYMEKVITAK